MYKTWNRYNIDVWISCSALYWLYDVIPLEKESTKIKLSMENPIALHDDTVTLKPVFSLYKKNHHSLLLGKRFSKSLKDQFIL